jgi:hypothetical protein
MPSSHHDVHTHVHTHTNRNTMGTDDFERNPGVPLDMGWVNTVRVNKPAVSLSLRVAHAFICTVAVLCQRCVSCVSSVHAVAATLRDATLLALTLSLARSALNAYRRNSTLWRQHHTSSYAHANAGRSPTTRALFDDNSPQLARSCFLCLFASATTSTTIQHSPTDRHLTHPSLLRTHTAHQCRLTCARRRTRSVVA